MQEQTKTLLDHQKKFSKCVSCPLGIQTLIQRKNLRIYYAGPIPCDVLVIGDSPSEIDLAVGEPFSGLPGDLLRSYLDDTFSKNFKVNYQDGYYLPNTGAGYVANIGFTTSVVCPSCDQGQTKLRSPKKKEVDKCSTRLNDIISLCDPYLFLVTGRVAEKALLKIYSKEYPPRYHYVCSPASIIRQEEAGVIDIKRTKTTLTLLSQELLELQKADED